MAWNGSDNARGAQQLTSSRLKAKSSKLKASPHQLPTTNQPTTNLLHGLLAFLVIALLGGAAVWFLTRPAPPPPAQPVSPRHQAQNTVSGRKTLASAVKPAPALKPSSAKIPDNVRLQRKTPGNIASTSPQHAIEPVTNDVSATPIEAEVRKPVVFSNETDQLIAMATSNPPDVPIPPLPHMGTETTGK